MTRMLYIGFMNGKPTFGFPDTLPPLGSRDLLNCCWFAITGILLLLLGFFHNARFLRIVLVCWLALPVLKLVTRKKQTTRRPMNIPVVIYTFLVVGFGIGFTFWARHLHLVWPVVIGSLFLIEGLSAAIASLTEWWRLSLSGHAIGLMICGFAVPLVDKNHAAILVGGAVVLGSLLSACILWSQLCHLQRVKLNPDS